MTAERVNCKFHGRGCKRTFLRDGEDNEVICGRHFRLADPDVSKAFKKARRRALKFLRAFERANKVRRQLIYGAVNRAVTSAEVAWRNLIADVEMKLNMGFEAELKARRKRAPTVEPKRLTQTQLMADMARGRR